MKHEDEARKFLDAIGEGYANLHRYFVENGGYTDDEFDSIMLRCHDTILRSGIRDSSPQGCRDYFFLSMKRSGHQRSDVADSHPAVDLTGRRENDEEVLNRADMSDDFSLERKVRDELYADFAAGFLTAAAEDAFALKPMHFYCWKMRWFGGLTYRQLREITGVPGARRKCKEVEEWLAGNVPEKTVEEAFNERYPEFGSL